MEHINENTIRVKIENTDLEERGITFLDLLGNQKQIENFFYSILEEVDIHEEFQETESVTFQVVPKKNGLELYISKGNSAKEFSENLLPEWEEGTEESLLKQAMSKEQDGFVDDVGTYQENEENGQENAVFVFENFEDVILLAKKMFLECGVSNLYFYKDKYYLDILFFVDEMIVRTSSEEKAIALEYGENGKITGDVLEEHGKQIMETNALELLRHYFPA